MYLTFSAENTKYVMTLFISMEKVSEGFFFVCLFAAGFLYIALTTIELTL